VRAITAILDNRSAALPDVPTIAEAGFPELLWGTAVQAAGIKPD
jgi:tripartite-type tricarboxylate transporter receptor subunit TctC